eukprot:s357_g31.t1
MGATNRDQLVKKPSQDVEHRTEWSVDKRDDWATTLVVLLGFAENITGWSLASTAHSPGVGASVLGLQFVHKDINDLDGNVVGWCEDLRVHENFLNSFKVEDWAKNAQGRRAFVFTVEDRPWKELLKLSDGRFGEMGCNLGFVLGPQGDRLVFDKKNLERWIVTGNVMSNDFMKPLTQESADSTFKVWRKRPGNSNGRGLGGRFAFPPLDGCVNGLEGHGATGFLNIAGKATEGIGHGEATLVRPKKLGCFEPRFGVGTKVVDQLPHGETVLKPVGGKNLLDHRGHCPIGGTCGDGSVPETCSVAGRADAEFGLQGRHVNETDIDRIRLKEVLHEKNMVRKSRGPEVVKIGTTFQNGVQLGVGVETVDDHEKHQTSLSGRKSKEQHDGSGCCEGSEDDKNEDHGMDKVEKRLKVFVLELAAELGA